MSFGLTLHVARVCFFLMEGAIVVVARLFWGFVLEIKNPPTMTSSFCWGAYICLWVGFVVCLLCSRESVALRRLSTCSSKRRRRNTNDTQYRGVRGENPEQVWTASPQCIKKRVREGRGVLLARPVFRSGWVSLLTEARSHFQRRSRREGEFTANV